MDYHKGGPPAVVACTEPTHMLKDKVMIVTLLIYTAFLKIYNLLKIIWI